MLARALYNELFLTVTEAARRLKVSRGTIYNLMRTGQLAYIQLGGVRRIPGEALVVLKSVAFEEANERLEGGMEEEEGK